MGIKIEINAASTDELRTLLNGFHTFVREGSIAEASVTATADPITTPPQFTQPAPPQQPPVQQPAPIYPPQYPTNQPPFGQQPTVPTSQPQQPVQSAVPTSAPTYTIDQLGVACGPLVDAGRGPELTTWINQRGAQALTQLDRAYYGEFATYLRSLGAKI